MRRSKRITMARSAIDALELPDVVFTTCPWQPRELVETGLRQWLRCCAVAIHDNQVIGMPSHVVDEAWHGLILCTARYQHFCHHAYGRFMHHHPAGETTAAAAEPMAEQLRRTVIAWSMVADPGERCVLWDLDRRLGLDHPWGLPPSQVSAIAMAVPVSRPRRRPAPVP